jgi:U3 small nucleolar RNA-associated protein 22
LSWISRWDWRHVPLVVDFSATFSANPADLEDTTHKGMKSEDVDRLRTRFEAWRRIDPAMNRVVLFVATNLDEEGTTWTDKAKPEKVVAARLTALAKAATQAVRADEDRLLKHISNNNNKDVAKKQDSLTPESLFTPGVSDFDIVITISSKHTLKLAKSRKPTPQFKNLDLQKSTSSPSPAATPLPQLFAQDLLEIYGDAVLWFWDPETLDKIVGLWNPIVTAQRSWKVKPGWNSIPVAVKKDAVEIQANKEVIVHEIKRLGGELVKSIDVKS